MTFASSLADARTLLFVPGNRPERFEKAISSGADAVVLDLEDSVPGSEKPAARDFIVQEWARMAAGPVPLVIRLNAVDSESGQDDLAWLTGLSFGAGIMGIMVPKAECSRQLREVRECRPDLPLLPLIESAAGFVNLAEIAGSPGALRLVIGHVDFMADTGIRCSDDERELDTLRFQVAMQTRVHRLAPAVDGVTVAIADDRRLIEDTRRALSFGLVGKLCIHPRQVPVVHRTFAPSEAELDWARRVVAADAAAGGAAVQVDGRMVDLPVVLQARTTLARARPAKTP